MRTPTDYAIYLAALSVIIGGTFGVYDAVMNPVGAAVHQGAGAGERTGARTERSGGFLPAGPILRVVIIGVDERPGDKGRSDTLMVAYMNKHLKNVALLSIPRDLRVDIPRHGKNKVNAAYPIGGEKLTVETVEDLIGEDTHFFVKINLDGFVNAVDTLGGVEITVPDYEGPRTKGRQRGMRYDDNWGNLHIDLKPGRQHLDGKQAMGFVRYRNSKYGGAISDLERAKNQQTFIKELVKQKLTLWNAPNLLKAGSQIMSQIDTDLNWQQTVELFNIFRGVNPSEIYSETVPVGDTMLGGIYYSTLLRSEFSRRLSRMDDFLRGRIRTDCPVTVLNGCGRAGVAGLATKRLQDAGFEQVLAENAKEYNHTRTSIKYEGEARIAAERVREALGCGRIASTGGDGGDPHVTVTIGSDFEADR